MASLVALKIFCRFVLCSPIRPLGIWAVWVTESWSGRSSAGLSPLCSVCILKERRTAHLPDLWYSPTLQKKQQQVKHRKSLSADMKVEVKFFVAAVSCPGLEAQVLKMWGRWRFTPHHLSYGNKSLTWNHGILLLRQPLECQWSTVEAPCYHWKEGLLDHYSSMWRPVVSWHQIVLFITINKHHIKNWKGSDSFALVCFFSMEVTFLLSAI